MNPIMSVFVSALGTALSTLSTSILSYLPTLASALVVFYMGVYLSRWMKSLTLKILTPLKLSKLGFSATFREFLQNSNISHTIDSLIGEIVRYSILILFTITALNLLEIRTLNIILISLLSSIPKILAAILILTIGVIVGGFVEKVIKVSLQKIDLTLSRTMAKAGSYTVVTFAALAAMSQLGIAENFINILFIGFVATLAIAFGLSVGLGSKDLVKNILENWYKNNLRDK